MFLEKGVGQAARFVEIKIDVDAGGLDPVDQCVEVFQALFIALALLGLPGEGRELIQQRGNPDAAHAGGLHALEIRRREGIDIAVLQGIAVEAKIGRAESRIKVLLLRHRFRILEGRAEGLYKLKKGFLGCQTVGKVLLNPRCDLGRLGLRLVGGGRIGDGLRIWLQTAELDEEEVVLAQHKVQLLRVPVEQGQHLVIGQQMPVAADHGDVGAGLLLFADGGRAAESHAVADLRKLRGRRLHGIRHTLHGHEIPVAPDEGMKRIREVGRGQRLGRGAGREIHAQEGDEGDELNGHEGPFGFFAE